MRGALDVCGCFPTGRHYPGIADRLARAVTKVEGLAKVLDASEPWAAAKLAVIDFETTGLTPEQDRIIEVGVACFEAGQLSAMQNWLVNPGRAVSQEVLDLTGIDAAELDKAPPLSAVMHEFEQLLMGHLPVAYNAPFDSAFLREELRRLGIADGDVPPAFDAEVVWIDPLVWVRELHKEERSKKLGDVCKRLGIPLDNAHRAASDAEATGKVLLALADKLPGTYGELIRLQVQYAARQEVDMSANWRRM